MKTECKASSSEEPGAGIPHAGICAGGARQRASLPRYRLAATNNAEAFAYTANALNQYTNISDGVVLTPTYDYDGNMTNYGVFAFTWDGENRLTGVSSNDILIASYGYDYMSRRYQKIVGATTNTFAYDGWNQISETIGNPQSTITNLVIWGLDLSGSLQGAGGIGGLLSVTRNGSTYFPYTDANGNITDYVDTNGTVVAHRDFDAFGNTIFATGPLVHDQHFWFSSKYLDEETSLYYYGYRYYSPELGRWTASDPKNEDGFVLSSALTVSPDFEKAGRSSVADWFEPLQLIMLGNNPIDSWDWLGLQDGTFVNEKLGPLCSRCGPEITRTFNRLVRQVRTRYNSWGYFKRRSKCDALMQFPQAIAAWDVKEFNGPDSSSSAFETKKCPRGLCNDTVQINGQCHYVKQLNYLVFGVAMKLCKYDVGTLIGSIWLWKVVEHHHVPQETVIEFAKAGYNGYPMGGEFPQTPQELKDCASCPDCYEGPLHFLWSRSRFYPAIREAVQDARNNSPSVLKL